MESIYICAIIVIIAVLVLVLFLCRKSSDTEKFTANSYVISDGIDTGSPLSGLLSDGLNSSVCFMGKPASIVVNADSVVINGTSYVRSPLPETSDISLLYDQNNNVFAVLMIYDRYLSDGGSKTGVCNIN